MQFNRLDPRYSTSERAQHNFWLGFRLALALVALLWLIYLFDWLLDLNLRQFGIYPRHFPSLPAILWAPLLHGSVQHLLSNSLPLLVLGTGLLYLYPTAAFQVVGLVYLGAGVLVWLLARPALHLGASGLIYGLAAYLFVAGLLRRDIRALAAALLVYFLYGSLAWGVLPIRAGVSWETHLAAALLGIVLAVYYRHLDKPPLKRYDWEDEEEP